MNRRRQSGNSAGAGGQQQQQTWSKLLQVGLGVGLGAAAVWLGQKLFEETPTTGSAHSHRATNDGRPPLKPSDTCVICLEQLAAPMEQLPCQHLYHEACIMRWLETKSVCPFCAQPVTRAQLDAYRQRQHS